MIILPAVVPALMKTGGADNSADNAAHDSWVWCVSVNALLISARFLIDHRVFMRLGLMGQTC